MTTWIKGLERDRRYEGGKERKRKFENINKEGNKRRDILSMMTRD